MAAVDSTTVQQESRSTNPADPLFFFAPIAHRYDRLNRLMSLGRDLRWRRIAAELVRPPAGGRVLDVGAGTGDMALALLHRWPASTVVGVEPAMEMMRVGRGKPGAEIVRWAQGDGLCLPFSDAHFDAVVSAFVLRNVADVLTALAEQRRVVRPGGRVVCLEMTWPRTPGFRTLFHFYFARLMPVITGVLSGQPAAYRYLPRTVQRFLAPKELQATMERVGLQNIHYQMLGLGTVALHVGERGGEGIQQVTSRQMARMTKERETRSKGRQEDTGTVTLSPCPPAIEKTGALDTAATRGLPSFVWRAGQERRFQMVCRWVTLPGQRVLDVGCGVGMYTAAFLRETPHVFGVEIERERALEARERTAGVVQAPGERLPFPDATFDVVFSHEVLEHVADDRGCVAEMVRVTRPGGCIVVFAPNRLYPFETHGIFWRGRYRFGNVPLVNWLPTPLRDRLAPHVRAYTAGDLRRLFDGLPVHIVHHTVVFPGYDNIVARAPALGRALRAVTYALERTPLRAFGLSHLLVVERDQP